MSATAKNFTNNSPPACEDDDLNGFARENNNLIEGSGQVLDPGDNQQTHKAVAIYAGVGDFYNETGIADAYVLAAVGARVAPPSYTDGERIRFVVGNSSTGPSTINGSGRGVKNFTLPGGADFGADTVVAGDKVEAEYDAANGRFELRAVQATESRFGEVRIATLAEAIAGVNDTKALTPLKMAGVTPIRQEFMSTAQTIVTGGVVVLAHGFGVQPKIVEYELKCLGAEFGYGIGDVIGADFNTSEGTNHVSTPKYDAANITVRFSNAAGVFAAGDGGTGFGSVLTNANWELYVRAFA